MLMLLMQVPNANANANVNANANANANATANANADANTNANAHATPHPGRLLEVAGEARDVAGAAVRTDPGRVGDAEALRQMLAQVTSYPVDQLSWSCRSSQVGPQRLREAAESGDRAGIEELTKA